MKSSDILSLLSRLESTLSDFSFDELSFDEASQLRTSFQTFKADLRNTIEKEGQTPTDNPESIKPPDDAENLETGLMANVGHEIRGPLNGIISFTDSLKNTTLDEDQLSQVNAIQSASTSLLEIVNELLEYSKLVAGEVQFQRVEFNLFGLVRDVMFLCNTLITNKNVTLTSSVGKDVPENLIGDPSKLTQVILNLMGNAIKFVEEGEVHLNISALKGERNEHLIQFEIADNGIGIAIDKIDEIFDPYKQADSKAQPKYGGTSLGLSIVKQIVDKLGGQVSVASGLNVGTTIKFTMPFGVVKKPVDAKKVVLSADEQGPSKQVSGLKILVFEDNELNQRLIEQHLKAWDCELHITDDGPLGMEILDNHEIHVILMDLRMPKMNGFEVTKLIRNSSSRRIRQIPIIALTADYTIRDKEKCIAYGMDDYLLKPFSSQELLNKLISNQSGTNSRGDTSGGRDAQIPEENDQDQLVNLTPLLSHCLSDMDIVVELIELFKQNIYEFLSNTKAHLKNEDLEGLRFTCHKIKAGLKMINANSLLGIIEGIRNGFENDPDWKHLEYLLVRFSKEYPAVEKAIDEAVEELKGG